MTIFNFISRIVSSDDYRLYITDYAEDIGYWDELTYLQQMKIRNRFITRFEFIADHETIIVKVRIA